MDTYEISRRVRFVDSGCKDDGASILDIIDAEIVLQVDDRKMYLYGQWVSQPADCVAYVAASESIYEVYLGLPPLMSPEYTRVLEDEVEVKVVRMIADGRRLFGASKDTDDRYKVHFDDLVGLIRSCMQEHGYDGELKYRFYME